MLEAPLADFLEILHNLKSICTTHLNYHHKKGEHLFRRRYRVIAVEKNHTLWDSQDISIWTASGLGLSKR